ncbi:hypothetical protein [Caballeronia sp. NK8]|uniref:hypothetical protein n=1 Tax=Caballeronia sp. NK8 TaxID=140098 RepID=UPI001BCA8F3D|nr:hypothetical protein [Caballeronia sp. NK8]
MTAAELIEILEGVPPSAQVRFAHQPSWPMECRIGNVIEVLTDEGFMVYLGEGEQVGYLPGHVTESLGWKG